MTDKKTSWSATLHDGYLERFATSASERTASLGIRVEHLGDNTSGGHGSCFEVRLNIVRTVHVAAWEPWGPLDPQNVEAFNLALIQGRMVSIEVGDFSASGLRIVHAVVYEKLAGDLIWPQTTFTEAELPVKLLTMDIDGGESDIGDRAIAIVFDEAEIFREGNRITVNEFIALGESYWRTFRETG